MFDDSSSLKSTPAELALWRDFPELTRAMPSVTSGPLGESTAQLLAQLLDAVGHGVMLVTLAGAVVHANRVARRQCSSHALLQVVDERLYAAAEQDAQRLAVALREARACRRSLVHLGGSPRTLSLAVIPLQPEVGPVQGETAREVTMAALMFERNQWCDTLVLGLYARRHRLTPTERTVLGWLCQDLTAEEVASEMGITGHTVRSHIKSMCHKTGLRGARELVHAVLRLPVLEDNAGGPELLSH